MSMRRKLIVGVAVLSACSGDGSGEGGTGNRIGDADGNLGPWFRGAHPCIGNRTDVMWFDDTETGFVGCGTTTEGYGLFGTADGGVSWGEVGPGTPLEDLRVSSISRGPDGVLYVAGTGYGGYRVMTIDGNELGEYYTTATSGAQSWETFHVGTFRIDSEGRGVAESLTGVDVIYWPTPTSDSVNGYGWWNEADVEGNGAQILDLEVSSDDRFYGVGSTISQPPYFFYEPDGGMGGAFAMEAIQLSDSRIGEVWDLAIGPDDEMMLAGVDEGADRGVLWYNEGDPTDAGSWVEYDIEPNVPDFPTNSTRFYGACREGDLMVAVGDYSQEEDGIVVLSKDGGSTWTLTGPPGYSADTVGPINKCQIFGDEVYLVGMDGYFGILDISSF